MTLASNVYNTLFRRNTTMLFTVFASAFALQLTFDSASNKAWDSINKGRQWKDIKAKYVQAAEEEDDE